MGTEQSAPDALDRNGNAVHKMTLTCPHCGVKIGVYEDDVGETGKCPGCSAPIEVRASASGEGMQLVPRKRALLGAPVPALRNASLASYAGGDWADGVTAGVGSGPPSLRDFYSVLFRHKWRSLLFFVVVVVVVTIGTFASPAVYESEAKLLVKPGRESLAVDPTVPEGRIISFNSNMEQQLNSELEILTSRVLVEKVVDTIGPERLLARADATSGASYGASEPQAGLTTSDGPVSAAAAPIPLMESQVPMAGLDPRDEAIRKVSKGLKVEALRNTSILDVTFRAQSPALAESALNELIKAYLDQHVKVYQTAGAYGFFQEQTIALGKELGTAEEELRAFKNTANVAALSEQRTALIQSIAGLQGKDQDVATRLAATEATVSSLEGALAQLSPTTALQQVTGRPNDFMDKARVRLLELRLQEKEALANYPGTSRVVENVREQIRQTESELAGEGETRTEVTTGINSAYQQMQVALMQDKAALSALKDEEQVIGRQIATTQEDLKALNDNETRLAQLERRRDIAEQNYRNYVGKLEETRISQALEQEKISNIAIVQPATMPTRPVLPRKGLNLALGAFLGFFGAIGLAFLSEYLDHSFRTSEDVEGKLGIRVLVSLPQWKATA